jgi:hypothetical protein
VEGWSLGCCKQRTHNAKPTGFICYNNENETSLRTDRSNTKVEPTQSSWTRLLYMFKNRCSNSDHLSNQSVAHDHQYDSIGRINDTKVMLDPKKE